MKKILFETFPISTNNMYAGRRIMTKSARLTKEAIGWEAREQYHGEPIESELSLEVHIYWPDKRRRDVDNLKMLFDALTGIVWKDDSQIYELHLKRHLDAANPRIELKIL